MIHLEGQLGSHIITIQNAVLSPCLRKSEDAGQREEQGLQSEAEMAGPTSPCSHACPMTMTFLFNPVHSTFRLILCITVTGLQGAKIIG